MDKRPNPELDDMRYNVLSRNNLEMWPGYLATTRLVNDGIFLNVDTAAKFINNTTILEQINERRYRGENKDEIAAKYDSSNPDA